MQVDLLSCSLINALHSLLLFMELGNYFIVSKTKTKINVIQGILDLIQGLQFILKMYIPQLPIKNFNITAKSIPRTKYRRIVLHQTNTKSANQFNHIIKENVGLDVK